MFIYIQSLLVDRNENRLMRVLKRIEFRFVQSGEGW